MNSNLWIVGVGFLVAAHYFGFIPVLVVTVTLGIILCVIVRCWEDRDMMRFDLNPFSSWPRKDEP
jgi:hypothetical protein